MITFVTPAVPIIFSTSSMVMFHWYGMEQVVDQINNDCCDFNNFPWFRKQLPSIMTDNIEMRLCREWGPLMKIPL